MVCDVLAGRRVAPRPGDHKIVRLLLGFGDGDIRIDARGIERHRVGARRPDRYFVVLAPFAVGELMDRSKLARLDGPTVAALRKSPIPGFDPAPDVVDLCAWFLPEPDALRIFLRQRAELPATPQPIPIAGPFAWPEPLPLWSPQLPKYRDEPAPRSCRHCRAESARFRELAGALVCPSCGRSFAG